MDITEKKEFSGLIQSIIKEYGSLNGIVHSAGIIRDHLILNKTDKEFLEVLAPKVAGLINVDKACKDLKLDFFIIFSSIAGCLGNPGQADYSAANAFMDAYARYRNVLVDSKQRYGQTLSVAWPIWQEGGMRIDKEKELMIAQSTGMISMKIPTGIETLYRSIGYGKAHVFVMEGELVKMKQKLLTLITPVDSQPEKTFAAFTATTRDNTERLMSKIKVMLLQLFSKLLKIKIENIDDDSELSKYGLDSITSTNIANKLNMEYGLELMPTIFLNIRPFVVLRNT